MTSESKKLVDDSLDERLVELVSYLDGELPEPEADAVEKSLMQDAVMRSDADILSRTWAMLDSLDEVSGSRQFTQDTLAVVATETKNQPVSRKVRSFRLLRFLAEYHVLPLFLAGLVFSTGGLLVARQVVTDRVSQDPDVITDRVVLEDFDMLQRMELYQQVPDAQSLKVIATAEESTVASETAGDSQ